jgi:hypothetical protein
LNTTDLLRIQDVISRAYAETTATSYGSGLLVYHIFCDRKDIPEDQRTPASPILIASFISTIAGSYAGTTVANYVHGIHAWHTIHGIPWKMEKSEFDALLKAAESLTPPTSRKAKREPVLVSHIEKMCEHLNLNEPLDAAVFACLTTTFWGSARVGETTVQRLDSFSADIHVKRSDVKIVHDRNGLKQIELFIPRTKSAPAGESISWAAQHGPSDPEAAFNNHLRINNPHEHIALFSYRHKNVFRPLTRRTFLNRIKQAALAAGLEAPQGHGIRIGSTLEYLLRGTPFDVVKVKGRWASNAFQSYLRKHGQILAPFMQADPIVHEGFIRYTMTTVR